MPPGGPASAPEEEETPFLKVKVPASDSERDDAGIASTDEYFSVDNAVEHIGMGKFQWLMLLLVALCVAGKGATITLGTLIFPGVRFLAGGEVDLVLWSQLPRALVRESCAQTVRLYCGSGSVRRAYRNACQPI